MVDLLRFSVRSTSADNESKVQELYRETRLKRSAWVFKFMGYWGAPPVVNLALERLTATPLFLGLLATHQGAERHGNCDLNHAWQIPAYPRDLEPFPVERTKRPA